MASIAQRAFSAGELSPSLYARADQNRYYIGAKILRNYNVKRSGGVENRPGTEYCGETKKSDKKTRAIPFVFNRDQTYALEFGDLYMRVIKNGEYVHLPTLTITGITNANPAVVTFTVGPTVTAGLDVEIYGVAGALGQYFNGRTFQVGTTGAGTFEVLTTEGANFDSTSLPAYTSGGLAYQIYELTTPYVEADLPMLKYGQSADIVTITHKDYAPREVRRAADDSWSLVSCVFESLYPAVVTNVTANVIGIPGVVGYAYAVSCVYQGKEGPVIDSGGNSGFVTVTTGNATLSATNYNQIQINTASGSVQPDQFNIYKKDVALNWGLIGIVAATTVPVYFHDIGIEPDTLTRFPSNQFLFDLSASGDYPDCSLYYQQRRIFANTDNNTERVVSSQTGNYDGYYANSPTIDSSAFEFFLSGSQVSSVQHMVDLGNLVMFTDSSEKIVQGDQAGVLTPFQINLKTYTYNGSAPNPAPIVIDNSALYVQYGGSIIRDFAADIQVDGYRGNDLTVFSSHLFDGYTIDRWAYQKNPNSIVWAVRSDGLLLSMTYIKEQQMLAWTRHDFGDDIVEDVCSIPNGSTYDVYFWIKRTINGQTKRYVERMSDRFFIDPKDYNFTDCSLYYDGRNTSSTTMTLSGSGWTYEDTLTCTASASTFTSSSVGNQVFLYDEDGVMVRFSITGYTSPTVVTGMITGSDVPTSLRAVATTDWAIAVDELEGLWHLEGKDVSVIGDSYVVSSPNNPSYPTYTVSSGKITLDDCRSVIRVGLPYISDIETLAIESPQGETIVDKRSIVGQVTVQVEKTRGVFAGTSNPDTNRANTDSDPLFNLVEFKARDFEGYEEGIDLAKGKADVNTVASWEDNAVVFLRQVDPSPVSILSIVPKGNIPFRG